VRCITNKKTFIAVFPSVREELGYINYMEMEKPLYNRIRQKLMI